jgi:hypothetical protein
MGVGTKGIFSRSAIFRMIDRNYCRFHVECRMPDPKRRRTAVLQSLYSSPTTTEKRLRDCRLCRNRHSRGIDGCCARLEMAPQGVDKIFNQLTGRHSENSVIARLSFRRKWPHIAEASAWPALSHLSCRRRDFKTSTRNGEKVFMTSSFRWPFLELMSEPTVIRCFIHCDMH